MDDQVATRAVRALTRFTRLRGIALRHLAGSAGFSPSQLYALAALSDKEELSLRALAERCLVDPSTMSRVVDGLVRRGLVDREPATDRRFVVLRLNALGEQEYARLEAAAARGLSELMKVLPSEQLEHLADGLEGLVVALEARLTNGDR